MKKILSLLLAVLMVLGVSSCAQIEPEVPVNPEEPQKQKFTRSYMDYFDTASTIVGYDYSQEEFDANCAVVEEQLAHFHTSVISGITSRAAKLVWRRPAASKGETRTRRWMPFSLLR